jgi:hypothetical protein
MQTKTKNRRATFSPVDEKTIDQKNKKQKTRWATSSSVALIPDGEKATDSTCVCVCA